MWKIWKRMSIYFMYNWITAEIQHCKSTTNIKIRKQRTERMYFLLSTPGFWQEDYPQTYSRIPIPGFRQPQMPMIGLTQLCHCPFLPYISHHQLFLSLRAHSQPLSGEWALRREIKNLCYSATFWKKSS